MQWLDNLINIISFEKLDFAHVLILALVQGLTEFLPVSSSAHLIFVPKLLGWPDQGLSFDVAVHVGTLLAVFAYFRQDIINICRDFFRSLFGKQALTANAKLMWAIGFATIPVGLAGLLLKEVVETQLRTPGVIAVTTVLFGLVLWWSDRISRKQREIGSLNWKDVASIGFAQALSLIPGTSRSGITLTAGLMMGLSREAAARFSFLLAIPVILLAGGYESLNLIKDPNPVNWGALSLGILFSAISGYFCIHIFLKMLNRVGVLPFVIYRVILGGVLFTLFV
jgi:undecaprenyl-diphosphatase